MSSFPGAAGRIAAGVYLICAAVLVAFALSGAYLLAVAGGIADAARGADERDLVRNEIARQVELLAHDQSQISHWDETVRALADRIDWDFVRREIADWLWTDFGIQTTLIVAPDGTPRVTIFEEDILGPHEGSALAIAMSDLIGAARANYMRHRRATDGGFYLPQHPVRSELPVYEHDFRMVDGGLSLVVAQAVVPDDTATLPDGPPQVLLTVKPLDAGALVAIGEKLGLGAFRIAPAAAAQDGDNRLAVGRGATRDRLEAIWTPTRPSQGIWARALPVLVAVLLAGAAALALVGIRYAQSVARVEESEARNRFLAYHDALTGLANRLRFDRELEAIAEAGDHARCAVLCLDLDRFKAVNDMYGHPAGDAVIRTVAERISACVGARGLVARIGGDEFILLLRSDLDRDSVMLLCDSIIESVGREIAFEGGTARVGASIGVAWWPDDARTAKTIIRSADEALYRAKEAGRGRAFLARETFAA